jgi:magnesium-transporting ATPase (P-type)
MANKEETAAAPAKAMFPYHAKSIADCFIEMGCSPEDHAKTGLTTVQAAERLAKFGPNQMSEKEKVTLLQRIWGQVANVLVGILVFVAVVSGIRAATAEESNTIITNWIQVGLIVFVIV